MCQAVIRCRATADIDVRRCPACQSRHVSLRRQVDGLCRRFEAELGECTVVSTGGLSGLMTPLSETIDHHEPWLTLHGLRLIFELNRD